MPRGYLALLLHAHLPYVRHPEHAVFLEENWLFEAITETYIPLLQAFERLHGSGIPFRLTLSLSPTLISMLQDELLQQRYLAHLQKQIRTGPAGEPAQTCGPAHPGPGGALSAAVPGDRSALPGDLSGRSDQGLQTLQQNGRLELITTAATHGFLPLLRVEPAAVQAQLAVAAATFEATFGQPAPGIWLPECGYYPGLEEALAEQGFRYFMVDSHGLMNASERPWHGVAAPLACPNGVAAFARDPESSRQVWSAQEGYPGDSWYREFHRDLSIRPTGGGTGGFSAARRLARPDRSEILPRHPPGPVQTALRTRPRQGAGRDPRAGLPRQAPGRPAGIQSADGETAATAGTL